MKRSGYSEGVIKDNIFVEEYIRRFEAAKLRQIELEYEINNLENEEEIEL